MCARRPLSSSILHHHCAMCICICLSMYVHVCHSSCCVCLCVCLVTPHSLSFPPEPPWALTAGSFVKPVICTDPPVLSIVRPVTIVSRTLTITAPGLAGVWVGGTIGTSCASWGRHHVSKEGGFDTSRHKSFC